MGADLKTYIPEITRLQSRMHEDGITEIDGYRLDDGVKAVLRNVKLYKPIVAAVNGTCVAGGMEMLGGCDIRVASDTATFGVLEPKRGLFAGGGRPSACPDRSPIRRRWNCSCAPSGSRRPGPGHGAAQRGVPAGPAPRAGLRLRPPHHGERTVAVRKTKESVQRGLLVDMKEAYRIESAIAKEVFSSEDAVEGPKAFAEKRPPRWRNR